MSTATAQAASARKELAPGFGGELLFPDEEGYDQKRAVYNGMIDKRPALIASPADADGVAKVIAFARAHGLPIAVRGGGHNGPGFGTVDDGIVCDLGLLKEITVDPEAKTVRVGGGCTWGEVDPATHEHGLALPSGIISTTGVGGLTLGGGHGYLTRKYGLTIDNLLEAELVLADGSQVRANADENSDLFWAVRGGGGNFGVVTSFLFRAASGQHRRRRPDAVAGRVDAGGAPLLPGPDGGRAARPLRLVRAAARCRRLRRSPRRST